MTDDGTIQELLLHEIRNESTRKLEESFTWAKRWGCIVMFDQADIILQGDVDYGKGDAHGDMWDYVLQSMYKTHLQFERGSVHAFR